MSAIGRVARRWRMIVWRRPWIYWCVVLALAWATAAAIQRHAARLESARREWGSLQPVLVVAEATQPGDPIPIEVLEVPAAVVPERAIDPSQTDTVVARHAVAAGTILTDLDVGEGDAQGAAALVPDGWLAVPIVESPASGAAIGDTVVVTTDALVLAADGLVVGHSGDVTLVAVPADAAPATAAASNAGAVTLLLSP